MHLTILMPHLYLWLQDQAGNIMGYQQNLHPEPFKVTLSPDNLILNENVGSATITASLSAAASENTTIILTTSNTSTATRNVDYTLSADNLTIVAGSLSTSTTLNTINDNLTEGNETILIEITSVSGGNGASENGTQLVSITIIDDDNTSASDPSTNLSTLLSTNACEGCNLSGIQLNGDNLTGEVSLQARTWIMQTYPMQLLKISPSWGSVLSSQSGQCHSWSSWVGTSKPGFK